MTFKERKLRRQQIAQWISDGNHTVREAQEEFKVNQTYVYSSCVEFNVTPRRGIRGPINQIYQPFGENHIKAVELLKDKNNSMVKIGKKLGVSTQRISQIYIRVCENGEILPKRRRGVPENMMGITYHINICKNCGNEFKTLRKAQQNCSVECGIDQTRAKLSKKVDWPEDLPDMIKQGNNILQVAKRLGIRYQVVIRRLKSHHGWTKEMFQKYDGRKRMMRNY